MEGLSKEYQQQSESKFSNNFCPRTEYNHYRKATVLLYRQTLGQTKFLFYSKGIDDSCLEVPQGEFRGVDSAITFTAVRAILEETHGLLSDFTFNKLAQNQKITKEDLFNPKGLSQLELWQSPHFAEWLNRLVNCSCQYDELEGEIFFFLEYQNDAEALNAFLADLGVERCFKWLSIEDIKKNQTLKLHSSFLQLSAIIDLEKHIEESKIYHSLPLDKKGIYVLLVFRPNFNKGPEFDPFKDHTAALFYGIYRRNKETWLFYNAGAGEFPDEEISKHTKALIIPGAALMPYADEEWLIKARTWLKDFHSTHTKSKILGVCFGEQVLAHSLGGKAAAMLERLTDPNFSVTRLEEVELFPELYEAKFMKKNKKLIPPKIKVMEAHRNEIASVPEGFSVVGIEAIISKDQRCFGLQGHPEYSLEFFKARFPVLSNYFNTNSLSKEEYMEKFLKSVTKNEEDSSDDYYSRKLCFDFLKYEDQ